MSYVLNNNRRNFDTTSIIDNGDYNDNGSDSSGGVDLNWGANGSNLYNKNSGFVGIGTSTPTQKLDVNGHIKLSGGIVASNSLGNEGQYLKSTGTGLIWADISSSEGVSQWTNDSNGISYDNGKVGIGQSSDSYHRLAINGDTKIFGSLNIQSNKGQDNIIIGSNAGSYFQQGSKNIMVGSGAGQNFTNASNNIVIGANSELAYNANNQLNVGDAIFGSGLYTDDAKIGINKQSPETTLDVSGDVRISGGLKVGNTFGSSGQYLKSTGNGLVWSDISTSNTSKWVQDGSTLTNITGTNVVDINGDLMIAGRLKAGNSYGTSGQILSSTGSGIQWINNSSGGGGGGDNYWTLLNNTLKNNSGKVDISGDLLINGLTFAKKTNFPVGTGTQNKTFDVSYNYDTLIGGNESHTLGTVNPSDFNSGATISLRIQGQGASASGQGTGFLNGGVKILDNNNNILLNLSVGSRWTNNLGYFDVSLNNQIISVSPSQLPLSIVEYTSYMGEWIDHITAYVSINYVAYTISNYGFDVTIPSTATTNLFATDIANNKVIVKGDVKLDDIIDVNNSKGSQSQILSKGVNGIQWITNNSSDGNYWTLTSDNKLKNHSEQVDISGTLGFNKFTLNEDSSNNFLINKENDNFVKFETYSITTNKQLISTSTLPQVNKLTTGVDNVGSPINQPSDFTQRSPIQLFVGVQGILSTCSGAVCPTPKYPIPSFYGDLIWFEIVDKFYNLIHKVELKDANYDVNDGSFAITYYNGNFDPDFSPYDRFPLYLRVRKFTSNLQLEENYAFNVTISYPLYNTGKKVTFTNGDVYANNFYGTIHSSSLQSSFNNYYTKSILDSSFNTIQNQIIDISTNKVDSAAFNTTISNYYTKSQVDTSLSNYYSKSTNVGIGMDNPVYPLDVNGSAKFTNIRDGANSAGISGQVLSSTGTGLSWISPSVSTGYAVIRERQNAGVNAGYNFSSSTLLRRRLNNVVSNGITITIMPDISGNFRITEAGTYAFRGRACYSTAIPSQGYRDIFNSRIHIANETLGLDNAITGDTEKTNSFNVGTGAETLNGRNIWGNIDGILTLPANTMLSMKQYSYPTLYPGTTGANNAGIANNVAGTEEVYAVLTIQKLA